MVSPKKHLGQHFLRDENIARKIAASLSKKNYTNVVEVGAGTGALTKFLLPHKDIRLFVVEIDKESIAHLEKNFPTLKGKIIEKDFLRFSPEWLFNTESSSSVRTLKAEPFAVIGNFPYNISSQILFKILEFQNLVPEAVGMFQKEVAQRVAATSGSKTYGILSVLLQAYYKIEYLFTVSESVFIPPPKVKSAVIRLTRNETQKLNCDETLFFDVVKTAFNQRRKTLRNALSKFNLSRVSPATLAKRAEQLSVNDFIELTRIIGAKESGRREEGQ